MIRHLDHQVVVGLGHSHECTDHPDRNRCSNLSHPVPTTGGLQGVETLADPASHVTDIVLDVFWSERRTDEASQPGVDRWIEVDHRGPSVDDVLVHVINLDVTDRG